MIHSSHDEIRKAEDIQSRNRERDISRKIKPRSPCLGIHTLVQRCASNSGGVEHHPYGWGQGSLVQSGYKVMAVRAGFQSRAASWHSDEDDDVIVSHQFTQQKQLRTGVGRRGHGAQMHPLGTITPMA